MSETVARIRIGLKYEDDDVDKIAVTQAGPFKTTQLAQKHIKEQGAPGRTYVTLILTGELTVPEQQQRTLMLTDPPRSAAEVYPDPVKEEPVPDEELPPQVILHEQKESVK